MLAMRVQYKANLKTNGVGEKKRKNSIDSRQPVWHCQLVSISAVSQNFFFFFFQTFLFFFFQFKATKKILFLQLVKGVVERPLLVQRIGSNWRSDASFWYLNETRSRCFQSASKNRMTRHTHTKKWRPRRKRRGGRGMFSVHLGPSENREFLLSTIYILPPPSAVYKLFHAYEQSRMSPWSNSFHLKPADKDIQWTLAWNGSRNNPDE